jgi:hypothetical protein
MSGGAKRQCDRALSQPLRDSHPRVLGKADRP